MAFTPNTALRWLPGLILGAAVAMSAPAHHGWSSFDDTKPIFLEGAVKTVRWRNPHAELVIEVGPKLVRPADLDQRSFPKQQNPSVTSEVVTKAAVPADSGGEWTLELAPLTRLEAWGVREPIKAGQRVSAIGFARLEGQDRLIRVEILYLPDGRVVGLRSAPAS